MNSIATSTRFWNALAELVQATTVEIDRPKGSHHPRYVDTIYPLNYGYLVGSMAADGAGIDIWVGSLPDRAITGILCTVDGLLRDVEIKVLLGCTPDEVEIILGFQNQGGQSAILLLRPVDQEGA
ncbi:MAG: inorganic pyrophosphatase [Anaerolineae bacterium]|jgi:inorganic pyrophosphatase|nr:inorganic pyrophosphatase [Anaerolineae bacterium]